jgi:hypothetical protein
MVRPQHVRHQTREAFLVCARDRPLDELASEALALMGVFDNEGELCLRAVDPLPPPDTVNAVGIA